MRAVLPSDWRALFDSRVFHPGVILLVPNALVRRQVIGEILERQNVVLGPMVKTFAGLERELLAELDLTMAKPWLIRLRLNSVASRLWEPLGLPEEPEPELARELALQLADGLDRLRLAEVAWDRVETLEPKELAEIMADLGRGYEEWLGARDDIFGARIKLLKTLRDPEGHDFSALKGASCVLCAHSQRLSPFEAQFLRALAARLDVELRLEAPAWLLEENVTHPSGWSRLRLVRELEATAPPRLTVFWSDPETGARLGVPEALRFASGNLFGPPPPEAPPIGGSLSIVEVPTRYHEVEEIGRRLKKLLAEGVPAPRLAVAVPDMAQWVPAFEDVGRRFGLPMTLKRGRDARDLGPIRALLDMLGLWGSHWELQRILKVLESPYFDFDLPAGFRLALLEAGVLDDRESGGYASSLWRVRKDELNKILKPVAGKIDRLKRAGAALEASTSWREFRNILQSLVAHFKWPNIKFPEPEPSSAPQRGRPKAKAEAKAEAKADFKGRLGEGAPGKGLERFCGEEAERAIARRDAAAVEAAANAMIGLFDALQESSDAPKASLRNFRLWLDEALGGLSVQDPAQGPPGIEIMGYYDLHGARFDTLFLAGLNDRVFPAPAADPCWWPEAFVEGLAEGWLGRRLWSDAAETYQTREALVAQALGQASKVILSYHLAREDGRPMLPSPLLESLKGLFPEGELKVERPGWPLPPAPSRICDPGELWLSLAQKWPGADPPKIFARFQPSEEEASRLWKSLGVRRARISKRLGELPEAYLSAWLATLERHQGMPLVSLNLLTGYKECQRKFLLERLIGLDRWPVPVEEWEPKEWGDLLHETLEKFLRPAMEGSLKPLTFDCLKFLHWENAHRRSCNRPIGREPVWKAQVAREVRDLEGWFKRQALSKLKLMDLEWSFQPGGDAPPLAIETAVGPLAIQGRVDRLERLDGGIVLTDYKRIRSAYYSGDPGEGENRQIWEYQLVLYSLAVKSHFPAESVTSRIEFINPKDKEPIVEIPPGEPALLGGLWEAVFSRGLAPAAEMDSCQKCEFGALCAGGPQDG